MLGRSWIERSSHTETPSVKPLNLQVRTGVSAPFEPHMIGDGQANPAPSTSTIQVPAATFVTRKTG